jgi:hypothetical protein
MESLWTACNGIVSGTGKEVTAVAPPHALGRYTPDQCHSRAMARAEAPRSNKNIGASMPFYLEQGRFRPLDTYDSEFEMRWRD